MSKTLCDWSKHNIERHPDKLAELVLEPRYYCRKCARAANTSKVLCKPRELQKKDESETSSVENDVAK